MGRTVIKVENLSKLYRLGEYGTGTISHDLNRWWAKIRGKDDPFLVLGAQNNRGVKDTSGYAWALRNVDFELEQGKVLGVIGRNGAGKSTLLKLLSRITAPTSGQIKVKGRIASLLEVGTGFHPELTGRENLYLNGAILGMTKAEINRKFDEIVSFAGVEKYIDTPVKRYSSGMYVRLAFGVAAHLESEILIVDEVLAVGDSEFQRKCLGKMEDVAHKQGRTILFVSHNIGSLLQLCSMGLLLHNGEQLMMGRMSEVAEKYLHLSASGQVHHSLIEQPIQIVEMKVVDDSGVVTSEVPHTKSVNVLMKVRCNTNLHGQYNVGVALLDQFKRKVFTSHHSFKYVKGRELYEFNCSFHSDIISPGNYSWDAAIFIDNVATFEYLNDICPFSIVDFGTELSFSTGDNGVILMPCKWDDR